MLIYCGDEKPKFAPISRDVLLVSLLTFSEANGQANPNKKTRLI